MGGERGQPGEPGENAQGTTGGAGGAGGVGGAGEATGGIGGTGGAGGGASTGPWPVRIEEVEDPNVSVAAKVIVFVLVYLAVVATVAVIMTWAQPGPPF